MKNTVTRDMILSTQVEIYQCSSTSVNFYHGIISRYIHAVTSYILYNFNTQIRFKDQTLGTLRWHIPTALLNSHECCNQSPQQYIQEEETCMFQLKMISHYQV
jgi:hypothetical protein